MCVPANNVCRPLGFVCGTDFGVAGTEFVVSERQSSEIPPTLRTYKATGFRGLWLVDENFPIKNFARKFLVRQSQFRIWRELAGSNTNYPLGYLQVRQSQRYPKGYFHPLNMKYPTGYQSLRYPKGYFHLSNIQYPIGYHQAVPDTKYPAGYLGSHILFFYP